MNPATPVLRKVWGVRELLNYIGYKLTQETRLRDVGVRGEVTGFAPSKTGSGHVYFDLKEPSGAILRCFVRNTFVAELPALDNGIEAIAFGSVDAYAEKSQLQLTVTSAQLVGAGRLAAMYERIKRRLEAEGLFDASRKRALPRYPFRVALVSSAEAEGARDFRKLLRDKAPYVRVTLFPTLVQGPTAAESIVRMITLAGKSDADVVIVARGGGSDEDRIPFNDEMVARAIAGSPLPVMTAIGHQADHHIADDVADREAATPTDAVAILAANFVALPAFLRDARDRMRALVQQRIEDQRKRLSRLTGSPRLESFARATDALAQRVDQLHKELTLRERDILRRKFERLHDLERRLVAFDPRAQLAARAERLGGLRHSFRGAAARRLETFRRESVERDRRLGAASQARFGALRQRLALLGAQLAGKDPEIILQQGYAIVRSGGKVLRDAAEVAAGARIEAQLSRGALRAKVEETVQDG
jgi:exodeoxyribonuclease VII large subunit